MSSGDEWKSLGESGITINHEVRNENPVGFRLRDDIPLRDGNRFCKEMTKSHPSILFQEQILHAHLSHESKEPDMYWLAIETDL